MEIEARPPVAAKKLWNIVRIVFMMLKKGIAKAKLTADFHLFLKRGKLAAVKAVANTLTLHNHHHHHRTHNNNNNLSFLSPLGDYEFSCSNSPALNHRFSRRCKYDDVLTVGSVQRVLEMLKGNNSDVAVVEGNLGNSPYGSLPVNGKQLRITDSPFPLKDEENGYDDDDSHVDVAADEFIKRFYKQLHLQASMDSPYNHNNYHIS